VRYLGCLWAAAYATLAWAIPSGEKWAPTSIPVTFKLFQHSSINCPGCVFSSDVQPAVLSGFARWTTAQVACTTWSSTFGGNFTSPSGIAAINGSDGQNLLIWLGGADWTYSQAILGLTTITYDPGTGQILDADTQYNDNQVWKVGGSADAVDVESIATHEAGHFLGLAHTPSVSAVMYATYTIGDIKRDLDPGTDVQDVCTVYPSQTAGGTQGDLCQNPSNCGTAAPVCAGAAGGGGMICTQSCTTSASCPTGYQCLPATSGNACLVGTGSISLCQFCTNGTQCSNGLCVSDGPHMWCSNPCSTQADCGTGYTCSPAGTVNVCVPVNFSCPTAQCTSASQCPLGYICGGTGMCEATGNPGDRCEINAYCQNCSTCVGSVTEAFCQACCGGQGGGGLCNACASTTCTSTDTCEGLSNGVDSVCVANGQSVCQSCDATNPCQAGLTCAGNSCHPPCNPASTGNCDACGTLSSTSGVCACPGETSFEGQTCAADAQGNLHICVQGLTCVGTPPVCRAPCPMGICGTGDACQSVGGEEVCVPAPDAGTACGVCNGSSCAAGEICYGGRCYQTCELTDPACLGCVAVTGAAVCACDDEISVAGAQCGLVSGKPFACSPGLTCLNDGRCHVNCTLVDGGAPAQCPANQTCLPTTTGGAVCTTGSASPDGGTGTGGGGSSGVCVRPAATAPAALLLVSGALLFAVRQRVLLARDVERAAVLNGRAVPALTPPDVLVHRRGFGAGEAAVQDVTNLVRERGPPRARVLSQERQRAVADGGAVDPKVPRLPEAVLAVDQHQPPPFDLRADVLVGCRGAVCSHHFTLVFREGLAVPDGQVVDDQSTGRSTGGSGREHRNGGLVPRGVAVNEAGR
jgi:hypothetical protein